jgi:hypothetical protein
MQSLSIFRDITILYTFRGEIDLAGEFAGKAALYGNVTAYFHAWGGWM